jgi:hypothetical protein
LPRPSDEEPTATPAANPGIKPVVERLAALGGSSFVGFDERHRQAIAALEWLGQLADEQPSVYDLRRQVPNVAKALYVPDLSAKAAIVLGKLGTVLGQQELSDLASRTAQPLAARRAAALAFRGSVQRHGILLTRAQILKQYENYNASEALDADSQAVLASVLDALEKKQPAGDESASREP